MGHTHIESQPLVAHVCRDLGQAQAPRTLHGDDVTVQQSMASESLICAGRRLADPRHSQLADSSTSFQHSWLRGIV